MFDNRDDNKHSFTIEGVWDSTDIRANEGTRTSPALEPGTFAYTCTKYPTMNGNITVTC